MKATLAVLCGCVLALPGMWAQALRHPDIKSYFRFEQFGEGIRGGVKTVQPYDGVLLAGGNREFFRSTDAGSTWQNVLTPLQNKNVRTILAYDSTVLVGTSGGVYRTTDVGLYWTRVGNDPFMRKVRSLVRTSSGCIALTDSGDCFRGTDGDTNWRRIVLPSPCLDVAIVEQTAWFVCADGSVLLDEGKGAKPLRSFGPIDKASLLHAKEYVAVVLDAVVHVLKSNGDTDLVATWPTPIQHWSACVAMDNQIVIGGRSTGLKKLNLETGELTFVFAGPADAEVISALAVVGDTVIIGTSRGSGRCYVVSQNTMQWRALYPRWELSTFDVTDIAYLNGNVYVALKDEGVYAGATSGTVIVPIHDGYEQAVFHQLKPWGTEMLIVGRLAGIWRLNSGMGNVRWFSRTLPRSSQYFATVVNSRVVAGLSEGRIAWSDDAGATWTLSSDPLPALTELTTIDGVLYAGTVMGLYRSEDKGETWKEVEGPWKGQNIDWVVGTTDTLFINTTTTTYRNMKDVGIQKIQAESIPGKMTNFTSLFLRDGLLFTTGSSGVHISPDAGETWQHKSFEGLTTMMAQLIYKDYYYVVTDHGAMWRSPLP